MTKLTVIKTGGKQYLVGKNDEIYVDRINSKESSTITLDKLFEFDTEKDKIEIGNPLLKVKAKAKILEHLKGDKIRIFTFKAKSRFRKRKGFRASITKIKIIEI